MQNRYRDKIERIKILKYDLSFFAQEMVKIKIFKMWQMIRDFH